MESYCRGERHVSWHKETIAAFDLETTGVDPEEARIVSAAFIFISPDDEIMRGSFNRLADPEAPIPEEATAVHGINQEQLEFSALSRKEIIDKIHFSFTHAARENIPVVIYNARFDLTLFLAEAARLGMDKPEIGPIIDPLVIDRAKDKYRKGGRKLETVAAHYGVDLDDAHAAAADAIAAAAIACQLPSRYISLRNLSLDQLQEAQAKWYEDWKNGLNAWWKRKGIDKEIPAHEVWPTHLEY